MGGDTSTTTPADQQYQLRWNDFHSSILSSFRHLRDEEDFVDVTLACQGCSFKAHKVVLSACSPYFRELLKANPCKHPIIILRDVPKKDMESLLRFMYNGEVNVAHENLTDFIKTAQMLQVRGLADVSPTAAPAPSERLTNPTTTTSVEPQKISPTSSSLPWATDRPNTRETEDISSPPIKRARSAERDPFSLHSLHRDNSPSMRNNNRDMPGTLLGQALETGQTTIISKEKSNNFENSIQNQSTGEESCSSDAELSDQGDNDVATPKTEPMGAEFGNMSEHNPFQNGGYLNQNRPSPFNDALMNLGLGLMPPGTSGIPGNPNDYGGRRSLDMMRIRATDPRPCPKCGKIYRSAHTLRTHLEDKHTVCSGYRCVLCGTVAKSRNSLHSHMSRQHRGISTKDLPVLPMPAPFDPELASRLLAKAGVKITAAELRARASPTGPRRSDIKLDAKSAYSGAPSDAGSSICGENDPEDLTMSRYAGMDFSAAQAQRLHASNHHQAVAAKTMESYPHLKEPYQAPLHPPNPAANTTGSPLLDTYLQFISENSALAMMNPEHQAQAAAAMQAAKFAQLSAMGMDKVTQQQFFEKMQQQMQSANDLMFKRSSDEIIRGENDMVNDRGGTEMDRDPNSSGEEDDYSDDEMEQPHGLKANE